MALVPTIGSPCSALAAFTCLSCFQYWGLSMTDLERYEAHVGRLFKRVDFATDLIHATLGVGSEAGEIQTTTKKHWAYRAELDRENLLEELGDLLFYATALAQVLDFSLEQVLDANIEKLNKRYPSGSYSDSQALARADKESA